VFMELKKIPETAAEHLAEETGRPKEQFEPDLTEYPLPSPDELTWETTDE